MRIIEIDDRNQWNNFLLFQPTQATAIAGQAGIFLQSWEWLDFQAALGKKVWRLGITKTLNHKNIKTLVGICGVVEHRLPMGKSYLYAPRGPVLNAELRMQNEECLEMLCSKIKQLAKQEQAVFWKMEPTQQLHDSCFMLHASCAVQPKQTLILDLSKSENELLAGMHEKTRYNIRLAERKGIRNKELGIMGFGEFWKLMQETAKRDKFRAHPREYYEKMLEVLDVSPEVPSLGLCPPSPIGRGEGEGATGKSSALSVKKPSFEESQGNNGFFVKLWMAFHGTTPIACAIVGYFGDTATYLHGASSYEHRALMGPYALHWEIIKDAKKQGYKYYDFWGIKTAESIEHRAKSALSHKPYAPHRQRSWAGITRFKMGFASEASPDRRVGSGFIVDYPGTFDLPLNKFWYKVYKIGKRML